VTVKAPIARTAGVGLLAGGAGGAVLAHALQEGAQAPAAWLVSLFEPWVVACMAVSAGLYALGIARLWHRAGFGHGVSLRRAAGFAAGWAALVIALLSPLDALGSVLFSAHMVQHELLMLVAAPLLVLGRPLAAFAWALPQPGRRLAGRVIHHPAWHRPWVMVTSPLGAWLLHALAVWLWHVPALFDAALRNDLVHAAQHLSFLLTALLFWWSLFGSVPRQEQAAALLSLVTTMMHTGALGALLTLARKPWYSSYLGSTMPFGMDALDDQRLGGLIMWVPPVAVYIPLGLLLASRWLAEGRWNANRSAAFSAPGLRRSPPPTA
jgi:putative membrane protein